MTYWRYFIAALNGLTKVGIIVGFSLLSIFVMMQIVWRYILEIPLPWSEEAARYLLVWVSLLAVAVAFRNDSHIRLDYFFNRFDTPIRHGIWIFFQIVILIFLGLLLYYGIPNAILGKFTNSPGLNISLFAAYLSVPVSAFVMIMNVIDYIVHNFKHMEIGDIREKKP
jgi:TRAP-type C4-dicarboxylate transport system permease small subunit